MKAVFTGLIILLLSLFFLSWLYDYPTMLHLLPQGAHIWRQADCMAMAQNYQQFHTPFLQPAIYNLQSVEGKVAGEFPLFYFISAQFSHVALVLRYLHVTVFFIGIVGIYFIALFFLQRPILAIVTCWLICTSPLLIFYGNNFLSDVPALSTAFTAWAFFLYAHKKNHYKLYTIAFFCFALAGSLKASECLNFVLAFVFLLKFKKLQVRILPLFLFFLLPAAWYSYARQYNTLYQDHYYFLSIAPVWKLSLYDIGLGVWRMLVSLSRNYFWRPTSIVLIVSFYFVYKHRKRLDAELRWMIGTTGISTMLYILLFYQKMIGHEYYYVPFFIFIVFAVIGILKTYTFFHAENVFGHIAVFLFMIPNLFFCKQFVAEKLTDSRYNSFLNTSEMQLFLNKHGADVNKTILSLPDESPNKTLYLIRRKGYTGFNDYLSVLKQRKIDFILLGDEALKSDKDLQPYMTDSLAYSNGFTLYHLR